MTLVCCFVSILCWHFGYIAAEEQKYLRQEEATACNIVSVVLLCFFQGALSKKKHFQSPSIECAGWRGGGTIGRGEKRRERGEKGGEWRRKRESRRRKEKWGEEKKEEGDWRKGAKGDWRGKGEEEKREEKRVKGEKRRERGGRKGGRREKDTPVPPRQ